MLCTQSEGDYSENDQVHSRSVTVYPTCFHITEHTRNMFHLSSTYFINGRFLWAFYSDFFLTNLSFDWFWGYVTSMLQQEWSYNVEGDRTIIEFVEDFEGCRHVLFQWTRILSFALRDSRKLRKTLITPPEIRINYLMISSSFCHRVTNIICRSHSNVTSSKEMSCLWESNICSTTVPGALSRG
jgi:hypothetical protein